MECDWCGLLIIYQSTCKLRYLSLDNEVESLLRILQICVAGCDPAVTVVAPKEGSEACAITQSGALSCWWTGSGPQPSNYKTTHFDLGPVLKVAIGYETTCALAAANGGTLHCWARGDDGTYNARQYPPNDMVGPIIDIALGRVHACAVTAANYLRCWGAGPSVGGPDLRIAPADIGSAVRDPNDNTPGSVVSVSASRDHTCIVTKAGKARCWGYDEYQQSSGTSLTDDVAAAIAGYDLICFRSLFLAYCKSA